MGGSCISKSKSTKSKESLYIESTPIKNGGSSSHVEYRNKAESLSTMIYPCYEPSWGYIKASKNYHKIDILQMISKLSNFSGNQNIGCLLPARLYSYTGADLKKAYILSQKQSAEKSYKKSIQMGSHILIRTTTVQSLLLAPLNSAKIQISPEFECFIAEKDTDIQLSQQSFTGMLSPTAYLIEILNSGQYNIKLLIGEQNIRNAVQPMDKCSKTNLHRSCIFNGIIFRKAKGQINGEISNMKTRQSKILGQNALLKIFNEPSLSLEEDDILICYINSAIKSITVSQTYKQCYTYLELKSQIEQAKINLIDLFRPDSILKGSKCQLLCIYILVFCLKIVMFNNPALLNIPLIFLDEFIQMKSQQYQILNEVVNIMKFGFTLAACHDSSLNNKFIAANCCRNVLQISAVNSHILVDAYLHQFSLQINQDLTPIRHNPLYLMKQKPRCRFLRTSKPDPRFICQLKISWVRKQKQFYKLRVESQHLIQQQVHKLSQVWQQQTKSFAKQLILNVNDQIGQLQQRNYNVNQIIYDQFVLSIKIFEFIHVCQPIINLFQIQSGDTLKTPAAYQSVKRMWSNIIQQFTGLSARTYCSGQLALTILTIDNLLKVVDNEQEEGIEHGFNKCVDIWIRIYRDPKAKYNPYLPNTWIVLLAKIIHNLSKRSQSNRFSPSYLIGLQNLVDCIFANTDIVPYGKPSEIQWIIHNLPIRNLSGIYFLKQQLLAPIADKNVQLMARTGESLIDKANGDLSSKSNFSQSMSNTGSSVSRAKRRRREQVSQNLKPSENRTLKNGIYFWGKGLSCSPLLHPFAKNLNVLKITCGNYHVVIATTIGVFGWGENGSGQLGEPASKQTIRGIKMILPKAISSSENIALSCGNQHTAVLVKNQNLIMFGQSQSGITSGNGHKFDSICCGGLHTLGILNGRVYSWGRGEGGQLGHPYEDLKTIVKKQSTDFYSDEPKVIQNLPLIKKAVCGDAHSVVLSVDGDVFVFGFSYQGQLGLGLTGDSQTFQIFVPVQLKILNKAAQKLKIVDIYAGSTFTFFKTAQGQIYSCGLNDCNQLGVQKMMRVFHKKKNPVLQKKGSERKVGEIEFSTPNKIEMFSNQLKVQQIYCGENHCLASVEYQTNKMVMGWGLNKNYQISSQFPSDSITPRTIDNMYGYIFQQICCGNNFSIGLIKNDQFLMLSELETRINHLVNNSVGLNIFT